MNELKPGYKQTEVGVIPEDWEPRQIRSVCKLVNGRGFKPFEWKSTGLPIIRIQNLNGSTDYNYYDGHYDPNSEVRELIDQSRSRVAGAVNAELTMLYWQIGNRIRREILGDERAGYGEAIVSALGRQLTAEYGRGFSVKSLRHMIRFAETFSDEEKVSALRRQLSWIQRTNGTLAEITSLNSEVEFFSEIRAAIKKHSGEELDIKPYEADMRHLINSC